jgi:hypothetical protein
MREWDAESKISKDDEIVPSRGMPMNLHEALCPEAREGLARYGIIELVSVSVKAVPDPELPDDRLAMKETLRRSAIISMAEFPQSIAISIMSIRSVHHQEPTSRSPCRTNCSSRPIRGAGNVLS